MKDERNQCPFLTQTVVSFCSAFPIRKPIPGSNLSATNSPCSCGAHQRCPVFIDSAHVQPDPEGAEARVEPDDAPECVWIRQEGVAYRLCTKDYDCASCSFEQMLISKDGKYKESPEMREEVARLREMPAAQRRCKYMLLNGRTFREPCHYGFECWHCPTYQRLRGAVLQPQPV
ncbi:MAG: hypothetical protein RDV41_04235 [Planctomycetota bacterium]|nr:hypothetical protein [Planctomycetota bacterium]